jgi:hypothetical protein
LGPSVWCVIYDLYGLSEEWTKLARLVESSDPSMDVNPSIDQELSRPEPPGAIDSGGELLSVAGTNPPLHFRISGLIDKCDLRSPRA